MPSPPQRLKKTHSFHFQKKVLGRKGQSRRKKEKQKQKKVEAMPRLLRSCRLQSRWTKASLIQPSSWEELKSTKCALHIILRAELDEGVKGRARAHVMDIAKTKSLIKSSRVESSHLFHRQSCVRIKGLHLDWSNLDLYLKCIVFSVAACSHEALCAQSCCRLFPKAHGASWCHTPNPPSSNSYSNMQQTCRLLQCSQERINTWKTTKRKNTAQSCQFKAF